MNPVEEPGRIHIVIGDLSPALLEDILARLTELDPALHLVDRTLANKSVSQLVDQHAATVAIISVSESDYPESCSRLLDEFPALTVIGISSSGRRASIFVQDIGFGNLTKTIQATRSDVASRADREPV